MKKIKIIICLFLLVGCKAPNPVQKSYLTLKTIQYYSADYVIYRFGKHSNVIKVIDSVDVYNFPDTIFLSHLEWEKRKKR